MWKKLKSMLLGKRDVSKASVHTKAPAPRGRIAAEFPGRVLEVAHLRTESPRQEKHASTLPAKMKDVPTRAAENNSTSCHECRKAFTHQHRILEKRSIQNRDHICTVKEITFALASANRSTAQAAADLVPRVHEMITGQLQIATREIETHVGRVEQLIVGPIRREIRSLREKLDSHACMLAASDQTATEREKQSLAGLQALGQTCSTLADQQRVILNRLGSIEQTRAAGSTDQAIEQTWRQIKDFDEFIRTLQNLVNECRSDCFAGKFAAETISRLQGMRREAVTFLATRDAHLIDSVERLDPAKHRPLGTCPRPENTEGDGIVQRVGLIKKNGEKEQVCHPALVTLFDDVEV